MQKTLVVFRVLPSSTTELVVNLYDDPESFLSFGLKINSKRLREIAAEFKSEIDDDSVEAMFANEKELTQVLQRIKSEMGIDQTQNSVSDDEIKPKREVRPMREDIFIK